MGVHNRENATWCTLYEINLASAPNVEKACAWIQNYWYKNIVRSETACSPPCLLTPINLTVNTTLNSNKQTLLWQRDVKLQQTNKYICIGIEFHICGPLCSILWDAITLRLFCGCILYFVFDLVLWVCMSPTSVYILIIGKGNSFFIYDMSLPYCII